MRPTLPPLDTDVAIETPEHIVFRYRLAGPSRRFLAYLLDLVIAYAAVSLAALVVLLLSVGASAATGIAENAVGAGIGFLLVLLFAVQWVYFAAFEAWLGRTPGKAALGLRVVTTTGRAVGISGAVLRNVLRAADALPLAYTAGLLSITGFVAMAATRRFQRLGDLVAGTIVVVPERARPATPIVLRPPAHPSEVKSSPEDVWLDPDERQAIEMFLRRRSQLGRSRELELASMIAPQLGARLGWTHTDPSRALALYYDRAIRSPHSDGPRASKVRQ